MRRVPELTALAQAGGSPARANPSLFICRLLHPRGILMSRKSMIGTLLMGLALGAFGAASAIALNPQPEPPGMKYKKSPPAKRLPPNPCSGNRCVKQKQVKRKLPPNPCKGSACLAK